VWVGTSPSNRGGAQAGIEPAVSAGVDVTLPRRRPPSPSQVAALPSNSAAGAVARDLEAMAERTGATRRETTRWARGCSKHAFAPAAQFRPRIKAAVCHPPSPRAQSRHQRDQLASETSVAGDDPVNFVDPLGLWSWNPISDISQAAHDVGHYVAKHKAAITEIAVGVVVVTAVVAATVATGGLADAVAIGAAGASEEVAGAVAGGSAVGLLGLTFPLDAFIALLPVGVVGVGGAGLAAYGLYQLFAQPHHYGGGATSSRANC